MLASPVFQSIVGFFVLTVSGSLIFIGGGWFLTILDPLLPGPPFTLTEWRTLTPLQTAFAALGGLSIIVFLACVQILPLLWRDFPELRYPIALGVPAWYLCWWLWTGPLSYVNYLFVSKGQCSTLSWHSPWEAKSGDFIEWLVLGALSLFFVLLLGYVVYGGSYLSTRLGTFICTRFLG